VPKRVVFDIDDDLLSRSMRYAKSEKNLGFIALQAFEEYVNRREARTARAVDQTDKQLEDAIERVLVKREKGVK
jgi:hypothetical protein